MKTGTKAIKRPIVTCAMCKKHVTKQLEVRYQGKRYCCADCADACKKARV